MFTPLVKMTNQFSMPTQASTVNNTSNSAESANNATATFRDIDTSSIDNSDKQNQQLAEAMAKATENKDSGSTNDSEQKALSDERCKELFGNDCDLIGAIADLNEYVYRYKEGATEIDPNATPDEVHVGPIAQELKANPVTEACVEEDPLSGYLKVDTKQLSLAEMSILSAMAKRIEDIEKYLKELKA